MFTTFIIFVVVLSLLVFVHELGHFLTAKKMGMKVDEFGFGFPPRAFGIKIKETVYSINWIPLGGFVKIKGESGEHSDDQDSFASKPAWRRFLVLVAGVTMNIVLAFVLLSAGFMAGLPSVIDENVPASARVSDVALRIMSVAEDGPAAAAGIGAGDKLISIDGQIFTEPEAARSYIGNNAESGIEVVYESRSDGTEHTKTLEAAHIESVNITGIGVGMAKTGKVAFAPHEALWRGATFTGILTYEVVKAFGGLIKSLVVEQKVTVDLSGPVGIAVLTGEAASLGIVYLLQFTALLSINLAVVNILPFPALDGGRVIFLIIEKIRRKAVSQNVEAIVHNFGFLLLMVLVVLVTYRDFVKFGDQIWGALKGLIA